jgi:hypothetical protein
MEVQTQRPQDTNCTPAAVLTAEAVSDAGHSHNPASIRKIEDHQEPLNYGNQGCPDHSGQVGDMSVGHKLKSVESH